MSRRKDKRTAGSPRASRSGLNVAFLALCAVGVLLSADLLRVHVKVHTDPAYQSYCSVNEQLDCAAVAASDYAVVGGLPVALWGLLGYLALAAWALLGAGARRAGEPASATEPWGILCAGGALITAIGLALFYVSHFLIHSICLLCAGTYVVNVALFLVAVLETRRRGSGVPAAVAADLRAAVARPRVALIVLGCLAAGIVILKASITPYWTIRMAGPDGLAVGWTAGGQPWIGAADPDVEIVEFSDYQCPHCLRGHHAMRDLVKAYPDRVRLVHRHFPLDEACNPRIDHPFHVFACSYARLAWCAGEQGQFWEANDYIFQQGQRTERVTPAELARQLGLDATELTDCEKGPDSAREIDLDLRVGREAGVGATPTFLMNGKVYPGMIPPEAITAALEAGKPTAP